MKRLTLAFAAIAIASAAHATTFSWGLASGGSFDATMFQNATAYIFYGSNGSTPSLPDTSSWATKAVFTYSDLVGSGATKLAEADISNGLFGGTSEYSNYGSLVPADVGATTTKQTKFYMAVLSADGKNVALVNALKSATIASSTTVGTAKWATTAINYYTAAPEPTSGLMMLLGLGLVALKRKRA